MAVVKSGLFIKKPLFEQVRDALLERIAAGEWPPGAALPNEIQLSRALGVSAGTLRRALDALEAEHVLSRRQGRGTFVNDPTSGELAFRFHNLRTADGAYVTSVFKDVVASVCPADEDASVRLQLADAAPVIHIERVRYFEEAPYMIEQTWLPEALFPRLIDRVRSPYSIIDVASEYGIILGRAEERVKAATATGPVAIKLAVAEAMPVLELDRVIYSSDGAPVEWRHAQCHLREGHYRSDMP